MTHPNEAVKTVKNNAEEIAGKVTALAKRTPTLPMTRPQKAALGAGALAATAALAFCVKRFFGSSDTAESSAEAGDSQTISNVLHLVPDKDEGWRITREGSDKDKGTFGTKNEALDAARKLARDLVPSRLVVHGEDGAILRSHDYQAN